MATPSTPRTLVATGILWLATALSADANEAYLPPLAAARQPQSLDLVVSSDDPWITPAERSGLSETPRYTETVAWLQRLVAAAPELEMISIGQSDQHRDIWMVVASASGAATAKELSREKNPVLLVQAGIHGGEIDGKDAGMMLLRDLTVAGKRRSLLEKASLLFIPILNVDGHERFSRHGRINQRGPAEMGWRSNGRNLNLNRDYAKLETPGVRAVIKIINEWKPDLYVDVHVTDGVDYQYDITWGYNGQHAWSPAVSGWLATHLEPAATAALSRRGHTPGPLIFAKNHIDYTDGILSWTASPRYSSGYGDARHLATVLVENHSLKPYGQRVLGTYVLLESMLEVLGEHGYALRKASRKDRRATPDDVALSWEEGAAVLPESMLFKGIESRREYSPVAGGSVVRWTGVPVELSVAVRTNDQPGITVKRPRRYYIPAARSDIANKLRVHGIEVHDIRSPKTVAVSYYRLSDARLEDETFEGRMRIEPGTITTEQREVTFGVGDFFVSTDQPFGTLAMLLLEPQSPDSLLQWGYFLEIMNRTEYFETYFAEPMAAQLLIDNPELARRFREKIAGDMEFADDPEARLHWFYQQTSYHDDEYRLYPIARSLN
ncbi:MAG: M14 family metallopeptidase [Gammaproteobacteria bacterium]|nr:M14 family metallopeptidase [Gammaproteobacteria bacterium]